MVRPEDISRDFGELLIKAGWNPTRQVEIARWVDCLQREGFTTNPIALDILESVGGLTVRTPPAGINPYEHELQFDPLWAATGESDRAEEWKKKLDVDLFPIGGVEPGGTVVWVGSNGKFYFGLGFGLYLLGDSFGAAMDQLAFPESPLVLCAD